MSTAIDFTDARFGRPIRQLDRVLINKIAAGEVIERPASVVKELIENAFDAGATEVDIMASKAGATYISVADNGCGIRTDQIKLAFSRHATSKIANLDELFAVHSYGFRGEALPSIASVSHLVLTTRHFSQNEGTRVVVEGGKEVETRPAPSPVGSKVEVSHLFFNTPARRKFLKAETTEARHIVRVTERMALSKPSCAVSLILNDRPTFRLPAGQPIVERMATLFAVGSRSIVEYDAEFSGVSFLVYLAHPDQARQDRTRICLFINGRSVASSSLIHAVTSGYGEFLPSGRYPLACIYITVDPTLLDVNVHPTKAEVRLSEERAIHDNLYRITKKALRDWRLVPSKSAGIPDRRVESHQPGPKRSKESISPGIDRGQSLFARGQFSGRARADFELSQLKSIIEAPPPCDNSRPVKETEPASAPSIDQITPEEVVYLGRTGDAYLIVTIGGELYILDQHAAHERVLYEDTLRQVEQGVASAQKLLFPENVELTGEEYITFEESGTVLEKMGFEIEPFGNRAVIINAVPPIFKDKNPVQIVRFILDDILQLNKAGGDLIKSTAQSIACRAAIMAGDRLNEDEAKNLITSLFGKNNPYCCPHGRPTFIKISREELDGRFGRS